MKNFLKGIGIYALAAMFAFTALVAPAAPAFAQAQTSVFSFYGQRLTFSAMREAFAPAASATDFFTLSSTTKPVRVLQMRCDGLSTALANQYLHLIKRSAANTGGTSTAPVATPFNSAPGTAATAAVAAYTANPSGLGAAQGTVAEGFVLTGTAVLGGGALIFDLSEINVILNPGELLAINGNAASLAAGTSLNCRALWAES